MQFDIITPQWIAGYSVIIILGITVIFYWIEGRQLKKSLNDANKTIKQMGNSLPNVRQFHLTRKDLSELIIKDIELLTTNDQMLHKIKSVSDVLEEILNDVVTYKTRDETYFIEKFVVFNDLSRTIKDITEKNYAHALNHLYDLILNGKRYEDPLMIYELYIVKSVLDSILLYERYKFEEGEINSPSFFVLKGGMIDPK